MSLCSIKTFRLRYISTFEINLQIMDLYSCKIKGHIDTYIIKMNEIIKCHTVVRNELKSPRITIYL